jgi:hypothetical protein
VFALEWPQECTIKNKRTIESENGCTSSTAATGWYVDPSVRRAVAVLRNTSLAASIDGVFCPQRSEMPSRVFWSPVFEFDRRQRATKSLNFDHIEDVSNTSF